ncbi:MAG: hypothetical protein AAF518_20495 [Spirochaetota bacterium]
MVKQNSQPNTQPIPEPIQKLIDHQDTIDKNHEELIERVDGLIENQNKIAVNQEILRKTVGTITHYINDVNQVLNNSKIKSLINSDTLKRMNLNVKKMVKVMSQTDKSIKNQNGHREPTS